MRRLVVASLLLTACAHRRPILPDVKSVLVAREAAPPECKEIGPVEGRTGSVRGTREDALDDLRQEAANRGANYLQVGTWSSYGTAVSGVAYVCP